ncbi:MAG: hypothetical protein COT17_08530 [Elusimicrobia bacterium CG08_land_8_20_14_0_20_51_18]|nr:MAG: hypothetical protein COT17_08530 [Elusimicrobia bacterium CG08_land_8_20_14_0_20_51_18]
MNSVILTIMALVLAGYVFARFEKNNSEAERVLNKYLYYFGLPAVVIFKLYDTDIRGISLYFLLVNSLPLLLMMFGVYAFWKAGLMKANFARALIILSTLGNTVYFGFPVLNSLLGPQAVGYGALITSLHNLVIFTLGFVFINFICEDEFCLKIFASHIFKNAVFLSSVAGMLISWFSISLPGTVLVLLEEISKTALPLSLFVIGISLYGKKITMGRIKELLAVSVLKMALLPFLAALFIYLFQGLTLDFQASFIEYTMPVAVLAFVVAKELELDSDLVSQSVLFTTLLYFLLFPLFTYILRLLF